MKVYIAGACKNKTMIKTLMDEIEKWGYTVAIDWTKHSLSGDPREYASADIGQLSLCDVLIYCMDGVKSRRKYFELGYATALRKPIAVYMINLDSIIHIPCEEPGIIKHYINNESVFIKAGLYPIMTKMYELRSWLDNRKELNSFLDMASD